MNERKLENWEAFEQEVEKLRKERVQRTSKGIAPCSHLLFRGHARADWQLDTTLERYPQTDKSFSEYYRLIFAIRGQIETFSGVERRIPTQRKFMAELKKATFLSAETLGAPVYSYMLYLRHHGFPSPLLDWTRSPYIAAYFAYQNMQSKDGRVAIFVFLEEGGYGKAGAPTKPHIVSLGQYVRGHKRHFYQQSEYTVCSVRQDDEWVFAKHSDPLSIDMKNQDLLWKFTLPISEREKVLRRLQSYNINAYSLFGTEESLIETIALQELYLKDTDL